MKKILLLLFAFSYFVTNAQVQYGGVIRANNNAGVISDIKRNNDGLKVMDSTVAARFANGFTVGTFSATDAVVAVPDGNGTLINGASTSGSIISLPVPAGMSAWVSVLTGYTTGTVYSEASANSTNGTDGDWVEIKGRRTGTVAGIEIVSYAFTSGGTYRGNIGGFTYYRLRYLGTFTSGLTARISTSLGTGAVFLNSSIPPGVNIIGAVKPAVVQSIASNLTALNQSQTFTLQGEAGMTFGVSGTWVGTITFEASNDNFVTITSTVNAQRAGDNTLTQTVTSTAGNDLYRIGVSGFLYIRARMSAFTSGTATIIGATSLAASAFILSASIPAGANTIGAISNAAFIVNAGTNLNTSALALDATVAKSNILPSTALGTNTGTMAMGSVTTAAPAYAAGNINPLSLSTIGNLRVDGSSVTQPISGTVSIASSASSLTYSASISGLLIASTATDVFTITGSASKTIRILKVDVNGIQTTAGQVAVVLLRRSTANSAGTSTAPIATTYDATNTAATATALAYTANPTTGTLVGNIYTQRVFMPGAATASDAQGLSKSYGDVGQQGIVLRGITQVFAVNLAGTTVVGGAVNISIEWVEF